MTRDPDPPLGDIPGPNGWPVFGNLHRLLPNPLPYVEELHRRYGNVFFASFAMNRKTVFLLGPDAAEMVLIKAKRSISNRLAYMEQAKVLGDRGVLFRDGIDHRAIRQRMNPAFKPIALQGYLKGMNDQIATRISNWSAGDQPRIADEIRGLTLDIAGHVIAGAGVGAKSDVVISHLLNMLNPTTSFLRALPATTKWKATKGRAYMDHYFRGQIAERRTCSAPDLFTGICDPAPEQRLNNDEIVDNMIGLLVAGYETTAITIMMMLYFLARHPQWQERMRSEFGKTQSSGEMPFESLDKLVETEWVLKETLRLNPPLPFLPRKAMETFEFEGHEIPKGTSLIISPAIIHRMRSLYRNPEDFCPERFSDLRAEDKAHSCAWIPFGKGSHTCIGMHMARLEVKAFFSQLLARFRVEICRQDELRMRHVPVQGPVGADLHVRFLEI
jgi:cytochrome P450